MIQNQPKTRTYSTLDVLQGTTQRLKDWDHSSKEIYILPLTSSIFSKVTSIKIVNFWTAASPFRSAITHVSTCWANGQDSQSIILKIEKENYQSWKCFQHLLVGNNKVTVDNLSLCDSIFTELACEKHCSRCRNKYKGACTQGVSELVRNWQFLTYFNKKKFW